MKKHLIYFLGVILALGLSNCSSDDNDMNDGIELTVRLTIASNMQTRTPRPLEGVNNWQHVTDVRVFIFRSDTKDGDFTLYQPDFLNEDGDSPLKEYYIDVPDFNKTEVYTEEEFETHSLSIKPKLPNGFYRLLAIGVDEEENTKMFENLNLHVGTKWEEVLNTVGNPQSITAPDPETPSEDNPETETPSTENSNDNTQSGDTSDLGNPITNEFFSGISDIIEVSPSITRNYINIEMKRCVAGVLLYVTNFPNADDINSIKLILTGYNQTTDLVNRKWKEGQPPTINDIVLAEFSSNDFIADDASPDYGCYYKGSFLLPSNTGNRNGISPTLKLVYYSGENPIKTKKVKLIATYDGDFDYDNLEIDRDGLKYNLLANHLYCIGLRSKDKNIPIDLSDESDEVKIIVYGSWQADIDITL